MAEGTGLWLRGEAALTTRGSSAGSVSPPHGCCTIFVRLWQFRDGDQAQISFWSGLRPMTPDGPPVIGKAKYGDLFLNTGHGTLGWTMDRGSGRVLADLVSGRKPKIDISGLGIERYARRRGATPSEPQGAQA
jgi:hypothetical protein